jgi:hypothetical protein
MLIAIGKDGSMKAITTQVHDRDFRRWMKHLRPAQFQNVCDALNEHIDQEGRGEIATSSWIPGANWTDTPYQPIYEAVDQSWDIARFFFGLILWNVFLNRPETWSFGRYPKNESQVIGLTYFRVHILR